ncbi:Polyisoprenyl-teichoic acid--peptidoglycan teichoic acid transferase TagU [Austwickia sp. TVS 96-490-7B]|uniref:LCP family protein n=1 Tax=Austwickia sp. TVS 96-490-7B TaxID=2830843 RepID=UPI001D263590|nr:LCP family protein [Austwickia sp. TVS 96-490-7B]MBW3083859.1 Polyisoprenyl-teichoic acid--peptidoglycan teichoic acid transferase TagU [Austwickia sp. TVS 96-490-7B]
MSRRTHDVPSPERPPAEIELPGTHLEPGEAPRGRNHRMLRRVVVAAIAVVLLVLGSIIGYGVYLDHLVQSSLTRESLLPSDHGTADGASRDDGPMNILVVGSDKRHGESVGRSDVMVVAHLDGARRHVTLIHLPRDMQVPIPGHGSDKINAAYALGGSTLLVRTVQDLMGITINHVAITDFDGFTAMTDAIGGIDVDVAEASPGFPVGRAHLDGSQALAFVRERYHLAEGDISRGRRQQAFLKGLLLKAVSGQTVGDPRKATAFVDAVARHTTVDDQLTADVVRSLAVQMRSLRGGDISFVTAPISGFATRPDGAAIDVVDLPRMKALGAALAEDRMSTFRG